MRTDLLLRAIDHLEWADAHLLGALRKASPLPQRALEIYAHVVGAEQLWIARLNKTADAISAWPSLSLDECEALAAENVRALRGFFPLAEESAQRIVSYRTTDGRHFSNSVEDILLHVAMHGQYHRGQVNLLLRDSGAEPAPADYIAFIRGAAAATRS